MLFDEFCLIDQNRVRSKVNGPNFGLRRHESGRSRGKLDVCFINPYWQIMENSSRNFIFRVVTQAVSGKLIP